MVIKTFIFWWSLNFFFSLNDTLTVLEKEKNPNKSVFYKATATSQTTKHFSLTAIQTHSTFKVIK